MAHEHVHTVDVAKTLTAARERLALGQSVPEVQQATDAAPAATQDEIEDADFTDIGDEFGDYTE